MKKTITLLFIAVCGSLSHAANTVQGFVDSIETRESGFHGIYLSVNIPDEGCSLTDRAVLVESDPGGASQLAVLLAALAADKQIVVGVTGCTGLGTSNPATAPRIVKVQVYRQ